MYFGGITFTISKSFGKLQLVPEKRGLRMVYIPINQDGTPNQQVIDSEGKVVNKSSSDLDILIPLEGIGGLWSTTRAFLYEFESLDENIIMQGSDKDGSPDTLIKLYRDKPQKSKRVSSNDNVWLRIVTGRAEGQRRRIKLSQKDLLTLELACGAVLSVATACQTHNPTKG